MPPPPTLLAGLPVAVRPATWAPPPGWRTLGRLTSDRVGFLEFAADTRDALLALGGHDLAQQSEATLTRSGSSLSVLRIAGGLALPALGVLAGGGELRLDPARTWLARGPQGLQLSVLAEDVATGHSPSAADLRALIDGPVSDLVTVANGGSLSSEVLWGNVASVINASATLLAARRPDLGAAGREIADRTLALPQLAPGWRRTEGGDFRRTNCCLAFPWARALGEPVPCGDCVQQRD